MCFLTFERSLLPYLEAIPPLEIDLGNSWWEVERCIESQSRGQLNLKWSRTSRAEAIDKDSTISCDKYRKCIRIIQKWCSAGRSLQQLEWYTKCMPQAGGINNLSGHDSWTIIGDNLSQPIEYTHNLFILLLSDSGNKQLRKCLD